MTPRETILTALADLLRTVPHVPVLRGEVLPERIPPAGLLIMRDGDPGDPAVTLSPLTYHYQHRSELEVIVQGADRDTGFAALCGQIGAVIAADRTLGGLCDWIEAEAPQPVDLPSRVRPASRPQLSRSFCITQRQTLWPDPVA